MHVLYAREPVYVEGGTVPAEISCFNDYHQELALSLLYYLEFGKNHRQKVIEAKKYELNRQNNG